ncbi:MAG: truB [Parcubacteria group bacterium]|nr:truB [Parcubacteria group bacterium]
MAAKESGSEILKLYKNLGETPLECIERFRVERPEYAKVNMTYLGRLDPMAEGLLLVLAGNTRDKKQYLEWDKTYEFEVLWGFETDTYDTLGLVTGMGKMPQKLDFKMQKLIEHISKKKTQEYPPYSSRTVGGKALHAWAREGKIDEIDIPTRQVRIFSLEHTNTRLIKKDDLLKEIESRIALVKGDFRQEEILKAWKRAIELQAEMNYTHEYLISGFRADVSSGTYIRSLAKEMGEELLTSACAYSIKRIRVGEYRL